MQGGVDVFGVARKRRRERRGVRKSSERFLWRSVELGIAGVGFGPSVTVVKDLPTGRIRRLARLAALGSRAAAGVLGSDGDGSALASAALDTLGSMRGLALKVGQMASYVDGAVPADFRDAFERTLATLRDGAPSMTEDQAARVVEAGLGDAPGRLFAEWSPIPFAAASIGQVHRARLFDGREVAVKVQYAEVAKAVASDLANASMLGGLLGPFASKFGMREQLAEMRARFGEELDYAHEAAAQIRFAAIHGGDPAIRVPAVVPERSARRVLTTELAYGIDFEAARRRREVERIEWAGALWRFVFKSLLGHGFFNADPHPGNYLFQPEGAVCFLDFGCTRMLEPERVVNIVEAHRAAVRGDERGLFAAFQRLLGTPEGEQMRRMQSYVRACFQPLLARGPYRITREYAKGLWDELAQGALVQAWGSRKEFVPLPADLLFMNRLQLGFYSVLARLDVEVDFAAIEKRLLAREDAARASGRRS
jgi:predicted unusual protein kinase regulating ubiquinone biosynthesis (AarF/ABC1/UbiB family)